MQMNDLRNALRTLSHSPGFTLLAALLLAIGIGANAVIFGALDAILLRPLPVPHPEQLVHIVLDMPRIGHRSAFSYSFYRDLREHASTISTAFGEEQEQTILERPTPAEEIRVHPVTAEFFEALHAPALIGRTLTAADAQESAADAPVVLTYGFWRRRFDGDRAVIGRTLQLRGRVYRIVGVMPPDFHGISAETAPDVCVPLRAAPLSSAESRIVPVESRWVDISARLKPGVTLERAWRESALCGSPLQRAKRRRPTSP